MSDSRPSVSRRLAAAILAADIAGYSRLMGEDDAATPVSVAEPVAVPGVAGVAVSATSHPTGHFWRQLWRRKPAVLGLTLAAVVLLGALLAPYPRPAPRRRGLTR